MPSKFEAPERATPSRPLCVLALAHLVPVLWLFSGLVLGSGALYFRDISSQYAPDYDFLHRALRAGIWPLWNPLVDGGGPCLFAYPPDLFLAWLGGHGLALAVGPPLHLWLGLVGASLLAREEGRSLAAAWLAGAVYGLGGFALSCVNLVQLFQAWAWAPFVLVALRRLVEAPSPRRSGVLALLAALQLSTLSAEVVLQTAIAGLVLVGGRRAITWPRLGALGLAGLVAGLATAPVGFGLLTLLEGSARARGFAPAEALSYSASPLVLAEAALPRFFGDLHAFSDVGFWGQPLFPQGYPYLLSLYVGPVVLLLALLARPGRLHFVVILGAVLSLGAHGPGKLLLESGLLPIRFPIKFFFLVALALALLAAEGMDRARAGAFRPRRLALLAPGAVFLGAALLLWRAPEGSARGLARMIPEVGEPRAEPVRRLVWPSALLGTGALALAAGAALARGGRVAALAGVAAALDLLTVNASINPLTDPAFFTLRPPVRRLVDDARREGPYRWVSYGVANSPGLPWNPGIALRGSDVWLYYLDRQTLLPRTQALEGLEGIFDTDRTGWAPAGSTLPSSENTPAQFRRHYERMRRANVRWVLSFHDLPGDLAASRGEASLPEIERPLQLFELKDALPRAFFVPRAETGPTGSPAAGPSDPRAVVHVEGALPGCSAGEGPAQPSVEYDSPDPHTVRLRAATPPGYLVVLDFYHPYWTARTPTGALPLVRGDGRYWVIPVCGGENVVTAQYSPAWVLPALGACFAGLVIGLTLVAWPPGQNLTALGVAR